MSQYLLTRIQIIQQELETLKKLVACQLEGTGQKTKIEGLWEDTEVTEADLEAAEKAVFRDAYQFK